MTEDEREHQIIDSDKETIHRQGLESWLRNEEFIVRMSKNDEKYQKRIRYLMNWAKENSFEKPIWEREKSPLTYRGNKNWQEQTRK